MYLHTRRIITSCFIVFCAHTYAAEEKGTIPLVKNPAMEQRAKELKHAEPSPEIRQSLQETLQKMETKEWKAQEAQMRQEVRAILGLDPEPTQAHEQPLPTKAPAPGLPRGVLYVFVSHSVPMVTLRNYAQAIEGTERAVMVIRGFVGNASELKDTARFIHEIIKIDDSCQGPECETRNVEVDIDPVPFSRYDISRVPAVAYDKSVLELGHCDDPDALPGKISRRPVQVVYGDAPLGAAVVALQKITREPDLNYFKKKWSKGL